MSFFIRRYSIFIFTSLVFGLFFSILFYPPAAWIFATASILLLLITSVSSIFEKHRGIENERQKITRDFLILIVTLGFIVLLGWLAGTWVGRQAQAQFGARAGLLCALIVSFIVGYGVKKASSKLLESRA